MKLRNLVCLLLIGLMIHSPCFSRTSAFVEDGSGRTQYSCLYRYMGTEFSQVSFGVSIDGKYDDHAEVSIYGKGHSESLTASALQAGEQVNAWLSIESDENSVQLIVYLDRKKQGNSKLINPHVPIGKDVWGDCQITTL